MWRKYLKLWKKMKMKISLSSAGGLSREMTKWESILYNSSEKQKWLRRERSLLHRENTAIHVCICQKLRPLLRRDEEGHVSMTYFKCISGRNVWREEKLYCLWEKLFQRNVSQRRPLQKWRSLMLREALCKYLKRDPLMLGQLNATASYLRPVSTAVALYMPAWLHRIRRSAAQPHESYWLALLKALLNIYPYSWNCKQYSWQKCRPTGAEAWPLTWLLKKCWNRNGFSYSATANRWASYSILQCVAYRLMKTIVCEIDWREGNDAAGCLEVKAKHEEEACLSEENLKKVREEKMVRRRRNICSAIGNGEGRGENMKKYRRLFIAGTIEKWKCLISEI